MDLEKWKHTFMLKVIVPDEMIEEIRDLERNRLYDDGAIKSKHYWSMAFDLVAYYSTSTDVVDFRYFEWFTYFHCGIRGMFKRKIVYYPPLKIIWSSHRK